MSRFLVALEVDAPATDVWQRLVDWPAHARWVPATTISVLTARPDGVGARFVARSSLAALRLDRLGFDDTMEVTEWAPPVGTRPGRCTVRKLGRVVRGTAAFDVVPLPGDRSRVVWVEDIEIAPVAFTRPLAPLVGAAGRVAFGRALRLMAREVSRERAGVPAPAPAPGHDPAARPATGG